MGIGHIAGKIGAFYTPPELAEWVCDRDIGQERLPPIRRFEMLSILPAVAGALFEKPCVRVGGGSIKSFGIDIDPNAV